MSPFLQYAKQLTRYKIIEIALELVSILSHAGIIKKLHNGGIIFTLHHVKPAGSRLFNPNGHLEITPEFLNLTLSTLIELGLKPIRLSELSNHVSARTPIEPFFIFTLDDGYKDNIEYAAPIFKNHGVPFTIFVAKGLSERTHTMWWKTLEHIVEQQSQIEFEFQGSTETINCSGTLQKSAAYNRVSELFECFNEAEVIEAINKLGAKYAIDPHAIVEQEIMSRDELQQALHDHSLLDFGAHTVSHSNLAKLELEDQHAEIQCSIDYVESISGERPKTFAYPYGSKSSINDGVIHQMQKTDILSAVTTTPGIISRSSLVSPYLLPRVSLNGYFQKKRYIKALTWRPLYR